MSSQKTRVLVLYGGQSAEHEISLRSAAYIVEALDPARYDVMAIAIDKEGRWLLDEASREKLKHLQTYQLPDKANEVVLPASSAHRMLSLNGQNSALSFDVVFPILHGTLGEDGTVQGLLELANIPYVGAGVLCSAVAMDKAVAKALIREAGLPTPDYLAFSLGDWTLRRESILQAIKKQFTVPVFVKPANLGSSVGIHKVKEETTLLSAIEDAFQYDTKILIEAGLPVREIELSVLENLTYGEPALVSLPGEIVPTHEFYSYEAKYLDENGARLVLPAPLSQAQIEKAQILAQTAFAILNCEGMARVDLFLHKETGEFLFNEINTIPGFTSISMYPKLWALSGMSGQTLLTHLIQLAQARHQRKMKLKRTF